MRGTPRYELKRVFTDGRSDLLELRAVLGPAVGTPCIGRRAFLGGSVGLFGLCFAGMGCESKAGQASPSNSRDGGGVDQLDHVSPLDLGLEQRPTETCNSSQLAVPAEARSHADPDTSYARLCRILLSPDDRYLISVSRHWSWGYKGQIKFWNLGDNSLVSSITGPELPVVCLDPLTVLAWNYYAPSSVDTWRIPSGEHLGTLFSAEDKETVGGLAITPDGRRLLTVGSIGSSPTVRLWDLASRTPTTWPTNPRISGMIILPDNGTVVTLEESSTINLRSLADGVILKRLVAPSPDRDGHGMTLAPGGFLVVAYDAPSHALVPVSTMAIYDVSTGTLLREWDAHNNSQIGGLCLTPDGAMLVTAGLRSYTSEQTPALKFWSFPDAVLLGQETIDADILDLAVSASGGELFTIEGTRIFRSQLRYGCRGVESVLIDPAASTGSFSTYSEPQPDGSTKLNTTSCNGPFPPNAVCTCNCVAGTYVPPSGSGGAGGGSNCTCDSVCTCVPVST